MPFTTLEIELNNQVATIWMNRPDLHNAFDETLIAELTAVCIALDDDADVRVIVLAGRGKSFSAGADLNWMRRASDSTEAENLADSRKFAAMLRTLSAMSKPTIARVQGAALGGGTGLTAACDMAIAADDASFATSEVKFGIIPAVISPYVLRAIGPRHALRYFQSAERIGAQRALEMGLVGEVVPLQDLDAAVQKLADTLLTCGPGAQFAAKQLVGAVTARPIDDATTEETARRIAGQRATDEAKDGITAFLDKRPPQWMAQA